MNFQLVANIEAFFVRFPREREQKVFFFFAMATEKSTTRKKGFSLCEHGKNLFCGINATVQRVKKKFSYKKRQK